MKYSIDEIVIMLKDSDQLKEKLIECNKENTNLRKFITTLEDEIKTLRKSIGQESDTFGDRFLENPMEFLNHPIVNILTNQKIVYRFFSPIKDYLQYSETLNEFFSMSDYELLKFRGLGQVKLKYIRRLEKLFKEWHLC